MSGISGSPSSLRRRIVVAIVAATMLPVAAGCASAVAARPSKVEMTVVDRDTGQQLALYYKDGRSYVAGRPDSRYSVRLSNRSAVRKLVVLSVDGINVISGTTAGWNQVGYVLGPWQSFDISGWRKSNREIAAFEFAALRDSYAAQTNRPDNVGIIGMAVFAEKPAAPPVARLRSDAAPSERPAAQGSANASGERRSERAAKSAAQDSAQSEIASAERLGTAHGEREWSVSTRTHFERLSSTPQQVVEIAYDSFHNLVAAGIIRPHVAQVDPRSFPLNDNGEQFVPDPPRR